MKTYLMWICLHLHVVISNTLSYDEWYNNVWTKWKNVGYVKEEPYDCPRKQAFGKKGIIESPNYPLQYPSNADCTWVIETPAEYSEIRLRFLHFNVEHVKWSKICFKDSLEIFQYPDQIREKKGRYCGKHSGKEVTVYGNKAELKLKTNGYRNKRGFRIEWEAVKGCGGTFKNSTVGQLSLPYSKASQKLFFCQWKIETPEHHNKIILNIEKLNLPSSSQEPNCRKNSVQIIGEDNQLLAEYCNSLPLPKSIRAHGKFIVIKVKLYKKTKKSQFEAKWKTSLKRNEFNFQCGRPFVNEYAIDTNHRRSRRLVGGTPVGRGEWPWIVQVRITVLSKVFTTQTVTCGGVIISPTHVLTAAHCVKRINDEAIQYEVLYGSVSEDHPRQRSLLVDPDDITSHPNFRIDSHTKKPQNDIAVLKLKEKLEFGYDVQPICLPSKRDKTDENCHFAGWGKTDENSLHSSHVNSIEARLWGHCDRSPSVICATYDGERTGACKGDSGSPLVCSRKDGSKYLVGILSYGGKTCPSIVDGHIDVKYYLGWIHRTVQNSENM